MRYLTITAALIAVFCATANAEELVDRADANSDGNVSLHELRATFYADPEFNEQIEATFEKYDTDGDGLISETERQAKRAASASQAAPEPRTAEPAAAAAATTATGAGIAASESAVNAAPASSGAVTSTPVPAPATSSPPAASAPVAATATATAAQQPAAASASNQRMTRAEAMMLDIDDDRNGRVTKKELSNDGEQWFSDRAFDSADTDEDGLLSPNELEQFMQSMERRGR